MNGETDVNTGLMNEEEEQTIENEDNQEKNNPSEQSTVIMTGEELVKVTTLNKEGVGLSELGSSPLGSFQSLNSSQSSTTIPYIPP